MRHEVYHNTDEQTREYLAKALALVGELDPPHDLRPAVLAAAINLISAKQVVLEQVSPGILGLRG